MFPSPFVSHAQNFEDVVLHRVLGDVENGRYIDVGANDPELDSVTRAFYDAGWRGITVEPVKAYADRHRADRPEDTLFEVAITDRDVESITLFQIPDTGLSSLHEDVTTAHLGRGLTAQPVSVPTAKLDELLEEAGWQGEDIHFLSLDVEGSEDEVLRTLDLRRWRPWILVIEALAPDTALPSHERWEELVLAGGYRFALFDGLSRFYVAQEHWERLGPALAAPANVLDSYELARVVRLGHEIARLRDELAGAQRHIAELDAGAEELRAESAGYQDLVARTRQDLEALRQRLIDASATERSLNDRAAAAEVAGKEAARAAQTAGAAADDLAGRLVGAQRDHDQVRAELAAMNGTLSWRVTRPIRGARRVVSGLRHRR